VWINNQENNHTVLGVIVVHGGAGFRRRYIKRGVKGVSTSASEGLEVLRRGGSALDAVEASVCVLEDDLVFNAGKGSALNANGDVEMDAAIMDGRDLSAGAVALIKSTRNPVRLARLVMEKTDHILLAGKDAERLAEIFKLPKTDPITSARRRLFLQLKKNKTDPSVLRLKKNSALIQEYPGVFPSDTVGAVAADADGNFAAAASTGGIMLKLPGRIGDTPQIGCGLYADNRSGAATFTGIGEIAVRLVLSKTMCWLMENNTPALRAALVCVRDASKRLRGDAGIIAIDPKLRIAAVHNTPFMPWSYSTTKMKKPYVRSRGRIVARLR
jgi:beta-aspartyl-peptidase (threonine type)